jgi:5-formyltetrahydrofolate cyclo-ligase
MNKEELRTEYKIKRANLDETYINEAGHNIFKQILSLKEYRNSSTLLTYVSTSNEVDTRKLIEFSLAMGKHVAVPKCHKDHTMDFYYIHSFDELFLNKFGILEPLVSNNKVTSFTNSVCIIPGITFDEEKNRIGYGKGYYDRFLKDYPNAKVGLCYQKCLCKNIAAEPFDIKMDKVVADI